MKITIQINIDHENGGPKIVKSIGTFKRNDLISSTLGLTLEESKVLLKNMQLELIKQQIHEYVCKNKKCKRCDKKLKTKGHNKIIYRTLFGKVKVQNPRLYTCLCDKSNKQKSFSLLSSVIRERTAPELEYLQTKWSSLVSYGMTASILEDILPINANVSSIYNTTQGIITNIDKFGIRNFRCLL